MKKIVLSMLMVVILVMNTISPMYALSPSGEEESNIALAAATATTCPRCNVGELVKVCSGDHAYYAYADCWTAGNDHPYNCQTHQDWYYTDSVCDADCGYYAPAATETHIHAYDHTMYSSCADPNYCRY